MPGLRPGGAGENDRVPSTSPQRARRLRAPVVALALLALLPVLAACGGEAAIGEEPLVRGTPTLGPAASTATSASESPRDRVEAFGRIDDGVRRTFFPRPSRELRRWESIQLVTDVGRSVVRAAFPCASGFLDLGVDSSILAHAETVRREGDFLVSQQLTVFPVGSRAGRLADDLAEQSSVCDPGVGRTAFAPDRSFGVKDRSTLFAESAVQRARAPGSRLVDVVTVRGNAVIWTRIVSDRQVSDRVVRTQGDLGVRALAALTPTRR